MLKDSDRIGNPLRNEMTNAGKDFEGKQQEEEEVVRQRCGHSRDSLNVGLFEFVEARNDIRL